MFATSRSLAIATLVVEDVLNVQEVGDHRLHYHLNHQELQDHHYLDIQILYHFLIKIEEELNIEGEMRNQGGKEAEKL